MEDLVDLMQRCEDDTRRILGRGVAGRLGKWRRYASSEQELVEYIRRLLTGEHRENGWDLDRHGGLSLERIVVDHRPDLFNENDHQEARRTLNIQA